MSTINQDRRRIGALLRIPFQAVVDQIHRELGEAGYTDMGPSHYVVFQHLPEEGMRLTELADRAQMTKQSMSYLVDYLQVRGYVERVPDPVDGRAKLVRYTARGRDVDRVARQIVERLEERWAQRLGDDKMALLRQLLQVLIAELERER
jgi:DNA-binding MarR family transcriptional regulator